MIHTISRIIRQVLGSRKLFYVVIGLFVVQAVWLALTVQYPMAFDESYHFGIIQIYAHQWTPFITSATQYASGYGDLTRYDSYMYHYLMSFPYRVIAGFIPQQEIQIIILRLLNVGLFVGGLLLFHRLLRRIHLSEALTNFALVVFILIPVVPVLAATINYDNLVFLLVPVVTGLALRCSQSLAQSKTIPARSLLLLLIFGFIATLAKYAFAPIFVAILLYLLIIFIRAPAKAVVLSSFTESFKSLRRSLQIGLIIGILLSGGLFVERYATNIIQYHSLAPDCGDVQDIASCIQYGPWGRNYQLATNVKANNPAPDPPILLYSPVWLGDMVYRLYFAVNYDFVTYSPLPIPISVASIIGGLGFVLCFVFWRSILRIDRQLLLFGAIIVLYVGGLFFVNFTEYLRYRTVVAVNGRYLIVVLPLLFAWLALAYRQFFIVLFKDHARSVMALFSVAVILLLLQGGGALTYLVHSQPIWYWQDKTLIDFNTGLQKLVSPLIIGGQSK